MSIGSAAWKARRGSDSASADDVQPDGAVTLPLPLPLPRSTPKTAVRRGRAWLIHRALLAGDLAGLTVAFVVAQRLFAAADGPHAPDHVSTALELLAFFLALPLWVTMAHLSGLYGRDAYRADHSTVEDVPALVGVITVGAWLFTGVASFTSLVRPDAPRMAAFWAMSIAFVLAGRAVARGLARRSRLFWQNTLLVGTDEVAQLVARKLEKHPEYAINFVGFVGPEPARVRGDLRCSEIVGGPEDVADLVEELEVDRVIITHLPVSHDDLLELIRELRAISVQIDLVPRLYEAVGPRVEMHTVETLPLIGLPPVRLSPSSRLVKRTIDVVLASLALLLTSPLFLYIAWRIKRDSAGPVFYRHTRLGENMKEFAFLKFRTMRVDADADEHRRLVGRSMARSAEASFDGLYKPSFDHLVTSFGRKLRRTSLDELPQLVNVIKGDMSLVGPRPCIPYETEHFEAHHFERFLVPAGLTGLWQVAARNSSSFGEAVEMDVAYARSWSLGLDVRLLCRTPFAVIRQRSATA